MKRILFGIVFGFCLSNTYAQSLTETSFISTPGSADVFNSGYTFAYATAGTPLNGALISYGGFSGKYDMQINGDYYSSRISIRTKNGDVNYWNPWVELATKQSNNFVGNQYIDGNLSIGTATSNAKLTVQAGPNNYPTPLKAVSIIGPNSPANHNSAQDISWDFQHAGSATIRSYRGGSWDTYLQFLTNSYLGGNQPTIRMHISSEGNVGIGTTNPQNKLDVNGTIHSQEVKVDMDNWSDFVFKKGYSLPTLEEVEKHIVEKGHLENIPSEKEVLENGINLGEMNAKLLQKIEELTLYVIEMKKEIEYLKKTK